MERSSKGAPPRALELTFQGYTSTRVPFPRKNEGWDINAATVREVARARHRTPEEPLPVSGGRSGTRSAPNIAVVLASKWLEHALLQPLRLLAIECSHSRHVPRTRAGVAGGEDEAGAAVERLPFAEAGAGLA